MSGFFLGSVTPCIFIRKNSGIIFASPLALKHSGGQTNV
jgi:hypothetical protein